MLKLLSQQVKKRGLSQVATTQTALVHNMKRSKPKT